MLGLLGFYTRLSGMWRAILLIVAIFTAGLTVGAAASGITRIPGRVQVLEQKAEQFNNQLESLNRNVAGIRKLNQQTLCLTIAERQHSDWRKCLEE